MLHVLLAAALSTQGFERPLAPPWSSQPPMASATPPPAFSAPDGTRVTWQDQNGHTLQRVVDTSVTFRPGDLASLLGRYCAPQRDCYTALAWPWITQGMLETEIGSASTSTAYTALHRDYGVLMSDPRAQQMAYDWCLLHCIGKTCFDSGAAPARGAISLPFFTAADPTAAVAGSGTSSHNKENP